MTQTVSPAPRVWLGVFGCSVRPVIVMPFLRTVGIGCRTRPFPALLGADARICLTALFSGVLRKRRFFFGQSSDKVCRTEKKNS